GVNTTGRLHGELFPKGEMTRTAFEEVLGAMARANLVRFTEATFEKEGRSILYRKVSLTPAAYDFKDTSRLLMKDGAAVNGRSAKKEKKERKKKRRAAKQQGAKEESTKQEFKEVAPKAAKAEPKQTQPPQTATPPQP